MGPSDSIPFISLSQATALVSADVILDWSRALESQQFIEGTPVSELEQALCSQLGSKHAVACANGTEAIVLALLAAGVTTGMKIALPNMTFWATFEAVMHVGAVPVLIDIDPVDLQMDFERFKEVDALCGLDGLLLVHLFGWASERTVEFREYCGTKGLLLVEDGAQAYGVKIADQSVFSRSGLGTLSFYPAKVIGGCMDGGAVLCSSNDAADLLRRLKNHGRSDHYSYSKVGRNSRMSSLQALFLTRLLPHAGKIIERRREICRLYRRLLGDGSDRFSVFSPPANCTENGYLFVIELLKEDPGEVSERLKAKGIITGRVYPETIDQQTPAANAKKPAPLDRSRLFCSRVINLPLYFGLEDCQCERAAEAFLEIVNE